MQNMLLRMEVLKTLFTGTLIAALFIVTNASAQVSNVEGITPMDGVEIPKVQISQPQTVMPGAVFKDCDDCPEMVIISAGSFLMGSATNIGKDDEKPRHYVQIQSFAFGKYEVTLQLWFDVMGFLPNGNYGRNFPVKSVSWFQAQEFVEKLSQKTGKKYRLPSEAEWEYAARSGSTTTFSWGENANDAIHYAWYIEISRGLNRVGLKLPNYFGLSDMFGNVSEWTYDCWNENYQGAPLDGSALLKGDCSKRVVRGGSWISKTSSLQSTTRDWYQANENGSVIGFRVARDL